VGPEGSSWRPPSISDLSYSLYLWHFPVIVLLAMLVPMDTPAYHLMAGGLIAALSIACYHGVEDPSASRRG
jgi:peptidoglycan/LPS O-acetylase OafA/YrhL